jgi:hypothetical protein
MNKDDSLLYIGRNTDVLLKYGGNIGRKIHEDALFEIFGDRCYKHLLDYNENNVKIFLYKLFFLYFPEINFATIRDIKNKIEEIKPKVVFIESSQYGNVVKYIKRNYPIIIVAFFHNIELQYAKTYLSLFNIKSWWFYIMSKVNERQTVKYSDKCIVLNDRDAYWLQKLYNRKADYLLPVSLKDSVNLNKLNILMEKKHLIDKHCCLFVGSNFESNTQGLNWFIKKVMSSVNIHLVIIGSGMSKAFYNTNTITVMDYVEDLSDYYINADFIISPILSGGGMKTKTAEALMWGKAIIGTDEAFCGYEIDNIAGLYRCNNENEMIEKIQSIYHDGISNFNPPIRELFLEKYSFNSTIVMLKQFFDFI